MKQRFESEHISFVEVSEELVADYLGMVNDIENVDRFLGGWHEPYTAEQEVKWVRKKLDADAPVFSMIDKEDGRFIGNIEFMDPDGTEAELGIAITADKQDRGFGTEAVRAMIRYGMDEMGLNRITLKVFPYNPRAIHVYEKCGFREYGRTEKDILMEITK